jgi:prepilin-type N-terminal cleavage/methylation domain-containing protein
VRRIRRGFTLLELLIALILTAIVIGAATAVGAKAQRFHRELAYASDRLDQVNQTQAVLAVALRAVSPGDGDLTAGEARDTSIQFRATIGSSVVCDTAGHRLGLSPTGGSPVLSGYSTPPLVGDTVWTLASGDPGRWQPWAVVGVSTALGRCVLGGIDVQSPGAPLPHFLLTTSGPWADAGVGPGTPIRVTRLIRYSLYHASDGEWYLGAREWNPATVQFNGIQPVSGPFLSAARGGVVFHYLDTLGNVVAAGAPDTRGIARIDITTQSDSGGASRASAFGSGATRSDLSIAFRNGAGPQ